jgi:hypothetical protein
MDEDEDNAEYKDEYGKVIGRDAYKMRPPRSLVTRGSRPMRINTRDPKTGEWRTKIKMTRLKMREEDMGPFLEEYAKWGRIGEAAAKVGLTPSNIKAAMAADEEFAEAVMLAEEAYRDKLIAHHQNLVFNGTIKRTFGKDGQVVSEEQIYPIRLIELELKKHDAGYREKHEVDMKVSGGVVIAPPDMKSIEDWEKRFSGQIIDATATEIEEK